METQLSSAKDSAALRILVVDDVEAQFLMIRDFLTLARPTQHYVVEWAATFQSALAAINQNSYDVCLIDYNLGDQSGLDLLSQIHTLGNDAALIFMTGAGNREVDLEAMYFGAIDYIDKTELKPAVLERTVRYAAEQRNAILNEQKQRLIAEMLLDTVAALNSTLSFAEVLKRILANISKVIPHDTANIMLIEDDRAQVIGHHGYNTAELQHTIQHSDFSVSGTVSFRTMVATHEPFLVPDVLQESDWIVTTTSNQLRSYLGIPIVVNATVIGFINLDSFTPNFFIPEHADQLAAFAHHAAIAISNARAYERAQRLAAIEERQRLARDLHDAVSQTLFSANVIAESLPYLWEQNPDAVADYLNKLGRLTRGALAEMRSLLLELRPSALAEAEFGVLLAQVVKAFESRTETQITMLNSVDDDLLPVDVKIAFYRIVQEALNNITKHADAKHVEIRFQYIQSLFELYVQDDGQGFDQTMVSGDHHGLKIMQERADKIAAELNIRSEIGVGTHVSIKWSFPE